MTTKTTTKPPTGPAGVKIGDFFSSSWGYDQTNVDFYKVVGLTPKSVKIQKWTSRFTSNDGGPTTYVVPGDKPATYTDWSEVDQSADYWTQQKQKVEREYAPVIKRIKAGWSTPAVTINSYAVATLWDGKPEYQTGGGWGH